jgi:hypothetical protein
MLPIERAIERNPRNGGLVLTPDTTTVVHRKRVITTGCEAAADFTSVPGLCLFVVAHHHRSK